MFFIINGNIDNSIIEKQYNENYQIGSQLVKS